MTRLPASAAMIRPRAVCLLSAQLRPTRPLRPQLRHPQRPIRRRALTTTSPLQGNDTAPSSPSRSDPPDHRRLGAQQKLFTTSIYSPGSPLLLPHGKRVANRLIDFLRRQYVRYGFDEVDTPTIYKKSLWEKSGHLENYADDMFSVTSNPRRASCCGGGGQVAAEDEDEGDYGLKPMNCPGHCLIFASEARSYADLPVRYADFSPLHRNEVSGALSGLTRVRRFHQDDGHIFCRPSQVESEIRRTLGFVRFVYSVLRLGVSYRLVLSTRPADHFIGALEDWERAEDQLKRALDASGQEWSVKEGDGAFYGPKIDIVIKDSDGKEHQTATVQLDFQLPKRFDLKYDAPAPELEARGEDTSDPAQLAVMGQVTPVLIHRAVLGSVERLMALLIERYNGAWPFWLNPRQAVILTVNNTPGTLAWARYVRNLLEGHDGEEGLESGAVVEGSRRATGVVVDVDERALTMGRKRVLAGQKGYGLILTVGPRDAENKTVTVAGPSCPGEKPRPMEPEELLSMVQKLIETYQ